MALLTQLESLNLDSREVTDAGLAHITSLARLRSLDLFGAKVTDRGCAHLRCGLGTILHYARIEPLAGSKWPLSISAC